MTEQSHFWGLSGKGSKQRRVTISHRKRMGHHKSNSVRKGFLTARDYDGTKSFLGSVRKGFQTAHCHYIPPQADGAPQYRSGAAT